MAFAPSGRLLAVNSEQPESFALWDAESGKEVQAWKDTIGIHPAFSRDGSLLGAIGWNRIRMWEIPSLRERQSLNFLAKLAISPDARTLALNRHDGTTLLELASGKERWRIPSPRTTHVEAIEFSPDGRWLAWSEGSVVHLCDVRRGAKAAAFRGHDDRVLALCFSHDSRKLASSSADTTIIVWDVAAVAGRQ